MSYNKYANINRTRFFGGVCAIFMTSSSFALNLFDDGNTRVDAKLEIWMGAMHSQQSYMQSGTLTEGSREWMEGYTEYGLSGIQKLAEEGSSLYGAMSGLTSGTFGDGDPAGFTNGTERKSDWEELYLGWRSGDFFPGLGVDGLDISFGSQKIIVGDGFVIAGDQLNFGHEILDGQLNRGGGYYMGVRRSFDRTGIIRIGGSEGWRGDLMWLASDNPAQAKPEMAVATLEHVSPKGTVGLTYIDIVDIDDKLSFLYPDRKGTKVYSVRGQGNAGIDSLSLAGHYVLQNKEHGASESAWYLEAGWTLASFPWAPTLSYRYSYFSDKYDHLFYGYVHGPGTWFLGEVSGNFAGPFNTNSRVNQLSITANPGERLSVGAVFYKHAPVDTSLGDLGGKEMDIYALWRVTDYATIIPLVGIYDPDASYSEGGSQIGNDKYNLYTALVLGFSF
ncbi:hypothetical protein J3P89_16290 [Pseudomonas sp. Z1-14]|uniref:hypothetical protein n=1 Tax=Pseudomonas sp. Z1-14 TaxID=2817409 RepID=UPI003DAA01F6